MLRTCGLSPFCPSHLMLRKRRACYAQPREALQERQDSVQALSATIISPDPRCRALVCCHIPPFPIFMFRQRRPCRAPSYVRLTSLVASLQRVRMKATTLYMPNNMTCFVPVVCRHSTIEQSSCSNEDHRAAQGQGPRRPWTHRPLINEQEVILDQGSRLLKMDNPVP